MEVVEIADEIRKKIIQIAAAVEHIDELAISKATALANYDRQWAVVSIKLKNGIPFTLDKETIQNPPATLIDKLARGICHKEKLEAEKAEALYKSLIIKVDALQAMLNGFQSINRHLSTSSRAEEF